MTGARIQTVGTLRIETLRSAQKTSDGDYVVRVGTGTKVDTKKGRIHRLIIPRTLYQTLLTYIDSPSAKRRRKKSYYGDFDNNYIFLTRTGTPYYTSKIEKQERRNPDYHRKVGVETGAKGVSPNSGEAIRKYIGEVLLPNIRKKDPNFPNFSFHDLRATFGMNLLETLLRYIDEHNAREKQKGSDNFIGTQWAIEQVQERMGHANINTTIGYLNYRRNSQWRAKIISEVEDQLMQYIPDSALAILGDR
jgi:integrase